MVRTVVFESSGTSLLIKDKVGRVCLGDESSMSEVNHVILSSVVRGRSSLLKVVGFDSVVVSSCLNSSGELLTVKRALLSVLVVDGCPKLFRESSFIEIVPVSSNVLAVLEVSDLRSLDDFSVVTDTSYGSFVVGANCLKSFDTPAAVVPDPPVVVSFS
uniref:Uncharacterized protein n=1 Tax=Cacopsylla melanoneura TaxID=428564 RepID=A0A8D8ZE69_9HEMI